MSFGFSPSDVGSLVKLLHFAHYALNEQGGSKEDYQSLVQERAVLEKFLDFATANVQALGGSDVERDVLNNSISVLRARSQVLAARHSKFEKKLDAKAPSHWYRSGPAKSKWTLQSAAQRELQTDLVVQSNVLANQLSM